MARRSRCKATTKAGARCKRAAVRNRACEIKRHQALMSATVHRRTVTVGRREPAKHDAQCKACAHPELARVEGDWTRGALADADAANALEVSERAWQRHAAYTGLYEERARKGLLPYLSRVMDRAIKGDPTLSAGVAAARLAHAIIEGGERVRVELYDRLRDEERGRFFNALEELAALDEKMTPAQFIELLRERLSKGSEP